MGLEQRGGNSYFYRKARRGGRVVSEYMGGGESALLMARMDASWRERREARREDRKAERKRIDAEDAQAADLFDRIEAVARGALEAAGYHRHKRGEWRKRRMAKNQGGGPDGRDVAPVDSDERAAILKGAQEGDARTLPRLRALLDDEASGYAAFFGDMAAFAERALIASAAGKNLAVKEALGRKLEDLRAELAGPGPSTIERLLAERAAFCWLALYNAERSYESPGSMTLPQAEYHRRRVDSAHRRYLSSLRTLTTVRKLALPAIQVNIGENQVNVGGA